MIIRTPGRDSCSSGFKLKAAEWFTFNLRHSRCKMYFAYMERGSIVGKVCSYASSFLILKIMDKLRCINEFK